MGKRGIIALSSTARLLYVKYYKHFRILGCASGDQRLVMGAKLCSATKPMTTRTIPVSVFDLVVFGATGDLSRRKLLPALFHRDEQGQIPPGARIIGVSRRPLSRVEFRALAEKAIADHVPKAVQTPEVCKRFLNRLDYVSADASREEGWADLEKLLSEAPDRIRVFYLAVGPDLFGPLCERLGQHGLVSPQSRVVVEKPLGKDLASARALNDAIGRGLP